MGLEFWVYDCEVFWYDNCFVFRKFDTDQYVKISNDSEELKHFIVDEQPLLCGFNNKHYDQFILKACLAGWPAENVKELSDWLIQDGNIGWNYIPLKTVDVPYMKRQFDLMDDMQQGLSLKAIEGHLGMDIEESSISFDITRKLTNEEMENTLHYCTHDVDATCELAKLRFDYLQTKINIGAMVNIDPVQALSMTNAKLTAAFLGAIRHEYTDERDYVYPSNLWKEFIPKEVFDFFDQLKDKSIPDDVLWKKKLHIDVGGTPTVLGFGGIHSAIPSYVYDNGKRLRKLKYETDEWEEVEP